ncbi:MAG: hypothetical protein NVS2B16_31330 [Chloroflexota bacterium]
MLLDIHPEPEHARVQVRIGNETIEIGRLDDTAYIDDIHHGRAIVETLIQERLFIRERHLVFDSIFHASDVDIWLAYREKRSSRSVLAASTVEKARELLSTHGGEILVMERAYASRLRKL